MNSRFCKISAIALLTLFVANNIVLGQKPAPPASSGKPKIVSITTKPNEKICNFEEGKTPLDFSWICVTDTVMGGKSTGYATIVQDGANGTKQSLKLTGSVVLEKNPYIMFSGLATMFMAGKALYDVNAYTGIKFWAKGDGNTYRIDLPSAAVTDFMYHSFSITPPTGEWKEYKVPFVGFKQIPYGKKVQWTGKDIRGIQFFTVGGPIATFTLQIDELEFYK